MKKHGGENGQTLIMVAVSLSVILGFVAFATDLGVVLHKRRMAQTAADSAAMAAAKYLDAGSAAAIGAGQEDAAANGFTNGSTGVTVTVTPSPTSGAFTGSQYAQVTVSQSVPTIFTAAFDLSALTVSASAIAGRFPSDGCVYVLDPTAYQAMNLEGSFDVSTPGCGVLVDSNDPNALYFGGTNGHLTAAYVNVVGGTNGASSDSTPAPVLGVTPVSDPLANLNMPQYAPDPSTCTPVPNNGVLTGSISSGNCYSGNVTLYNVTLADGPYFFTGQVNLKGTVTAANVTLYLTSTSPGLYANSQSTLTIANLDTSFFSSCAKCAGIVIYIEPPATGSSITQTVEFEKGTASGSVTGIIYAPGAEFFMNDSGSGGTVNNIGFNTDLIVNTFYDKTGLFSVTQYNPPNANSPLSKITLVE